MFSILKNIAYFYKSHLVLFLSIALACAVIVASLIVGDSLSYTLETKALNRLGKVESVVSKIGSVSSTEIAKGKLSSILALDAIALANGHSRQVKLYVVDENFWGLSPSGNVQKSPLVINETFAKSFDLNAKSQIVLRLAHRDFASAEIPLNNSEPEMKSASFDDYEVVGAEDFADFYLYDWQNSPPNVFISYKLFKESFDTQKSANLFLSDSSDIYNEFEPNFDNLGLSCTEHLGKYIVKSSDVFINKELINSILGVKNTLSWFVSKIDFKNGQDYNAFIVGVGDDLGIGEVEINEVYAEQKSLKIGDFLDLSYYVFDEKLRLNTASAKLKITKISPINEGYFIREIVPEYDGLTNVDDCTNWKSSIPIDLKKITDLDKRYWNEFGATPKFRVSYDLAKNLFANGEEKSTAILLDYDPRSLDFSKIDLQKLGFIASYPKKNSLENAQNGVDFQGLFVGLSFFVIFNALLLIYLILKMNLTARFEEINLLKCLGLRLKQIEKHYIKEFSLSLFCGAVLGVGLGLGFSKLLLFLLNSIWGDISGGANIIFAFKYSSFVFAFLLSLFLGFVLVKILLRGFFSQAKDAEIRARNYKNSYLVALGIFFVALLFFALFADLSLMIKSIISLILYIWGVYLSLMIFRNFGTWKKWNKFSFLRVGISNTLSKSVYLILSLGVYLLCVVGLNEIDSTKNISEYNYVVKTVLGTKVPEDKGFDFLSLRLKEGALANCLNLNKVEQAQVFGADINALIDAKVISLNDRYEGEIAEDVVEMYVDKSSMIWSLKASLGDEFEYETQNAKVKLKIVGALNPSIFQGSFIIADDDFVKMWSAIDAYNLFLARSKNGAGEVDLAKIFSKYLPSVDSAKSILNRFDALQNAYLKIFYQLGVLGLVLGVLGTLIATRSRLLKDAKLLSALHILGLRRGQVSSLITSEYMLLNVSASLVAILASLPIIKLSDNYLKALVIFLIILLLNFLVYPIVKGLVASSFRD